MLDDDYTLTEDQMAAIMEMEKLHRKSSHPISSSKSCTSLISLNRDHAHYNDDSEDDEDYDDMEFYSTFEPPTLLEIQQRLREVNDEFLRDPTPLESDRKIMVHFSKGPVMYKSPEPSFIYQQTDSDVDDGYAESLIEVAENISETQLCEKEVHDIIPQSVDDLNCRGGNNKKYVTGSDSMINLCQFDCDSTLPAEEKDSTVSIEIESDIGKVTDVQIAAPVSDSSGIETSVTDSRESSISGDESEVRDEEQPVPPEVCAEYEQVVAENFQAGHINVEQKDSTMNIRPQRHLHRSRNKECRKKVESVRNMAEKDNFCVEIPTKYPVSSVGHKSKKSKKTSPTQPTEKIKISEVLSSDMSTEELITTGDIIVMEAAVFISKSDEEVIAISESDNECDNTIHTNEPTQSYSKLLQTELETDSKCSEESILNQPEELTDSGKPMVSDVVVHGIAEIDEKEFTECVEIVGQEIPPEESEKVDQEKPQEESQTADQENPLQEGQCLENLNQPEVSFPPTKSPVKEEDVDKSYVLDFSVSDQPKRLKQTKVHKSQKHQLSQSKSVPRVHQTANNAPVPLARKKLSRRGQFHSPSSAPQVHNIHQEVVRSVSRNTASPASQQSSSARSSNGYGLSNTGLSCNNINDGKRISKSISTQLLLPTTGVTTDVKRRVSNRDTPTGSVSSTTKKKVSSMYGLTIEQRNEIRRKQEQQEREYREREEEDKRKEQERREESSTVVRDWLHRKSAQQEVQRRISNQQRKLLQQTGGADELSRKRDSEIAYKEWLDRKQDQVKMERKLNELKRKAAEERKAQKARIECEMAYKEWLRRKALSSQSLSRSTSGRRTQSLDRMLQNSEKLRFTYKVYLGGNS